MKQFSEELRHRVAEALVEEKKVNPRPIAAFDADGTLWDSDLGEGFFQYQLRQHLLPEVEKLFADPWNHYYHWKREPDSRPALMWLAQVNKGFPLAKVREWAKNHVQEISPLPIFPEQRDLVQWLQSQQVEVYVVTASTKWSVEPGAAQLGIPAQRVLGLQTSEQNGLLTDTPTGSFTFREGKAAGLLAATGGIKPFFCAGNTTGDTQLLECASRVRLAVNSAQPGEDLFKTESELAKIAGQRGWFTHTFKPEHR